MGSGVQVASLPGAGVNHSVLSHCSAPQVRAVGAGVPRGKSRDDTEDDEEDMSLRADILRKLTRAPVEEECLKQGSGSPAAPVSWKELEMSCQKLDDADIRITSLDLSCMGDAGDGTPRSETHLKSVLYNFEVDSSPASSHTGSSQRGTTPLRTNSSASLASLAASAPNSHLARSVSTESFGDQPKPESACVRQLRKHLAKKAQPSQITEREVTGASYSMLATPAKSAVTSASPLAPLDTKQAPPAVQVLQPAATHGLGDIVPVKPPQSFGARKQSSGSERTVSGRWSSAKSQAHDIKATKHSSFLQSQASKAVDPKTARSMFEAKSSTVVPAKPAPVMKSEYSSLVLPGARARPEARPRGVHGLFYSVKSKCGELFTTQKPGKAAATH